MPQADTKTITILSVIRSRAFQDGAADVWAGRGFRPSYETLSVQNQAHYERGRLFAAGHSRMAIKEGRQVSYPALAAFSREYQAGGII